MRTWRFFREFSTADENWLIPDTVQEDGATIVHRVSPTNLGFLLSSRLGALDLGFLTLPEFIAATERTLETAREMPKQKGHFYNWYNTLTLEPDSPRFLSTVDNGNLVCSLWTLKQGCLEAQSAKIFPRAQWQGILDHLDLICEMLSHGKRQVLARKIEKLKNDLPSLDEPAATWLNALPDFETAFAATAEEAEASSTGDEVRWWVRELRTRVHKLIELVYDFAPWLSPVYATLRENHAIADGVNLDQMTLENAPQATERVREQLKRVEALESTEIEIHAAISLLREALSRSAILCVVTPTRLEYLAEDADELAAAMDFKFLYNPQRKLLSVGYDAEAKQLNEAHYDLLASEARAAAFVAIAKGEIPQESWFKLSRSHLIVGGTPVLLSWTGTMFEYLLPCLWMKSHPNTLLAHNERAAFRSQQKYAKRKSIPWGISECASSEKMAEGAYRYHAFGVPDLALSHEDGEDLMVAPYSTFLGLLVDAEGSVKNLKRLAKMRLLGAYGFYEGADFTPSRLGADGKCAIARCWLAHHQGMSLVAAASVLCGLSMQRRFHAEPMVGATERILHERMPRMLKVSPSGIAGAVASTLIGQGRLALQRARSWSSTSPELTLPVHRAG
ncbi:MAG TPA: glucoamylase family protein [Candidatus Acidoferrales bacterium]|nr:glucoamylase family protein [Candidatus Acidoferrales bacterium]